MKYIHNQLLKEKGKFDYVYWITISKAFDITKLRSEIAKVLDLLLREDEEVTKRVAKLHEEEEALTLFLTKAIGHDTVLTPELEEIAAKSAKECPCLPLAIVTIAGSLRGLEGTRNWRNALNELISLTKDACDVVSRFIPVNELIDYWIAEELIADMDCVEAQLDKGHAVLGKLTSSCLLESVPDIHGMMGYIRVHDLSRDTALRITASSPRSMFVALQSPDVACSDFWLLLRFVFGYSSKTWCVVD
ncbi:hypothetical protein RHSIM_Rhsim11G0146800 [Rhododendron simsii]|uniref:NB-ARC domain-containing protein n=1 Tax=Rhododendron simsii TaxID=118357 RepID=A0A834LAG3_RHOSS|nr:hypothetical protein RHSIM_Rhsim11G0146800 [Rhododendron simsii]